MLKNGAASRRNPSAEVQEQDIDRMDRNDAPVDAPGLHEISELAYHLWVERGCPVGTPDEDWFHAEAELHHQV